MCNRVAQSIIQAMPTVPGVYMIEYLPTSQVYIGFSKNIDEGVKHRIAQHFDALQKGVHPNKKMQSVYSLDNNVEHWTAELLQETKNNDIESLYMKVFDVFNGGYDFNKAMPTYYRQHYWEVG